MPFRSIPMHEKCAQAIAGWRSAGEYAFQDSDRGSEDLAELPDSRAREGRYFSVFHEADGRAGFFCFDPRGDAVEIGPGLRPNDAGRGLGESFMRAGMEFAWRRFHPARFRLQVAAFNRRAIRVCEKLGFRTEKTFLNRTKSGEYEFVSTACGVG
jgi:ribosomal-protein-alanine N-acetyltransferase